MSNSHRDQAKTIVSCASTLRVDKARFLFLAGALATGACGSSGSTDAGGDTGSGGAAGDTSGATGGGGLAGAAGSSTMDASAGGACVPGDQKACACLGGGQGIQVCSAAGTSYGACGCGQDAAVVVPEAGTKGNPCGVCDGCCLVGATCVPFAIESAGSCGKKGESCKSCDTGFACAAGNCVVDQGQCSPASCPTGCCTAEGICLQRAVQDGLSCGSGGLRCQACVSGLGSCGAGTCTSDIDANNLHYAIRVSSIVVQEKNAAGSSWDPLGGLPDPYVCFSDAAATRIGCTSFCQDTTHCTLTAAPSLDGVIRDANNNPVLFSGAMLKAGVTVLVLDSDPLGAYDLMGSGVLKIPTAVPLAHSTGPFVQVDDVVFALF